VESLKILLQENPGLTTVKFGTPGKSRSLLHMATDWPGHFPNVASIITLLIQAGADPNARVVGGRFPETPLHWAASSDDVDAINALLEGGADIEALGASIEGCTALDNAVGYGQFNAARRLVERGARTKLWHAAALGLLARVEGYFNSTPSLATKEISEFNVWWSIIRAH